MAVISLDTNVVVRCLVEDDPAQAALAKRLLNHAAGVFIARTVLLETEWVMRGAYGLPRETIHFSLQGVCGLPHVRVEHAEQVAQALADYAAGMDFADALHWAASQADGGLWTFDAQFARQASKRGHSVYRATAAAVRALE